MKEYKSPSLASYISFFGWLSFLIAFGAFVGAMADAGAQGSAGGFWLAWGVAAIWIVVGLLLLAVAKCLYFLGLIAHQLGAPSAVSQSPGLVGTKQRSGDSASPARGMQTPLYHVSQAGKDMGAMSTQRIRQLLNSGQLKMTDLFFDPHSNDWIALDLLPD